MHSRFLIRKAFYRWAHWSLIYFGHIKPCKLTVNMHVIPLSKASAHSLPSLANWVHVAQWLENLTGDTKVTCLNLVRGSEKLRGARGMMACAFQADYLMTGNQAWPLAFTYCTWCGLTLAKVLHLVANMKLCAKNLCLSLATISTSLSKGFPTMRDRSLSKWWTFSFFLSWKRFEN